MGLYGAAIGAIAGMVAGAATAGRQAQDDYHAKKRYAQQLEAATDKYKGQNMYNAMQGTGENFGRALNNMSQGQQLNQLGVQGDVPMAGINSVASDYSTGNTIGQSMAKADYDAKFQNETAEAQNALGMNLTENAANRAYTRAAFNTAGGLAGLYKDLKGGTSQ